MSEAPKNEACSGPVGETHFVELYFISPEKTTVSKQAEVRSMNDESMVVRIEQELPADLSVMVKVIHPAGDKQINFVARVRGSAKPSGKTFEINLAFIDPETAKLAEARSWLGIA